MAEYIDREAAKKVLAFGVGVTAANALDNVPAADVAPVVHGRWTEKQNTIYDSTWGEDVHWFTYICSECEQEAMNDFSFCPNCGARMDGE